MLSALSFFARTDYDSVCFGRFDFCFDFGFCFGLLLGYFGFDFALCVLLFCNLELRTHYAPHQSSLCVLSALDCHTRWSSKA